MKADSVGPVLFCCILEYGKGSKMLKLSKQIGAQCETVLLGKGTIKSEWLNILGITETRKEIFLAIIDKEAEDTFYERASSEFALGKQHNGIAFSMPLKYFIGCDKEKAASSSHEKGADNMKYEAIFVVANKDRLDDILDAAEAAGSTGGTVIHGRGAGSQEKAALFNIEIEPEKVIVLILSQVSKTTGIVDAIRDKLDVHKPNTGIVFVMDVSRTFGLYEG
jgi:nitrogen regulatory protein PII